MADHPAGELVFRHRIGCAILALEDSRMVADLERAGLIRFSRPATATERELLVLAGYVVPDDDPDAPLLTHVTYRTAAVRNRTWPGLKLATVEETA